jgi:hypothetical protein
LSFIAKKSLPATLILIDIPILPAEFDQCAKARQKTQISTIFMDIIPMSHLTDIWVGVGGWIGHMTNVINIDDYDLSGALQVVAGFGTERYGYLVTPNVDHMIRHYDDHGFRALYAQANYVLLDSRFLAHTVALVKRQAFKVCLGSDLTTEVLSNVIKPFDTAVLVGGTPQQAQALRERFGLEALEHINPPCGGGGKLFAGDRGRQSIPILLSGDRFTSAGDHCSEAQGTWPSTGPCFMRGRGGQFFDRDRRTRTAMDAAFGLRMAVSSHAGSASHGQTLLGTRPAYFSASVANRVQAAASSSSNR